MDTGCKEEEVRPELKQVCLSVGVGWSDLHPGEGLSGITLSDRAGWLPDG